MFARGETLLAHQGGMAHNARQRKIPGRRVLVRENTAVNKRAFKYYIGFHGFHLKRLKTIQHDFCSLQKLLCCRRRNLFVCVSRIARPSGRNWVGLYEGGVRYGQPLLFSVHVIFFHSLPARVGCSFQGKLFSIFKLLCLVFVRY